MSQINNQPLANPLAIGDLAVVYSQNSGDMRRAALSAVLALFQAQIQSYLDSVPLFLPFIGGTANAISASGPAAVSIPAPFLGQRLSLIPVSANTGPATFALTTADGIVTKTLHKNGAALAANDLLAGVPVEFMYDGTYYSLIR